jgi:hypothetical protein
MNDQSFQQLHAGITSSAVFIGSATRPHTLIYTAHCKAMAHAYDTVDHNIYHSTNIAAKMQTSPTKLKCF